MTQQTLVEKSEAAPVAANASPTARTSSPENQVKRNQAAQASASQLEQQLKRPKPLKTITAAAAAIALGLFCTERLLVLTGLGQEEYIRPDALFGIAHIEGKDVTFKSEGFSRGKFSAAGLRDRDYLLSKDADTRRLAFLGDSKTEGMQVPMPENFVKLIEADLNQLAKEKKAPEKWQAINFATAGNGTLVELLHYLSRVKHYSPDLTVLVYNYGDSGENGQAGAINSKLARPAVIVKNDGALELSFEELDKWLLSENTQFKLKTAEWRKNSRLFQMFLDFDFNMRTENPIYGKASEAVASLFKNNDKPVDLLADQKVKNERAYLINEFNRLSAQIEPTPILKPRSADLDQRALSVESKTYAAIDQEHHRNTELTVKLVRMLNKACAENGSKLLVVTLPVPDNCTFYQWEVRALKEAAKREKFEVLDTNQKFPRLKPMEANPYYYTAHFSPVGHRVIADIIMAKLLH
ncbi:MAG: hypothetical protein K2Y32_08850 [Candidatus Obscuribacterales bacterium]|nr:hypothetical protein [Candidatus Obscuribacterales bacterium]